MLRSRYRRIILFFARVLLSLLIWEVALPRVGLRRWVERTRSRRLRRSAAQFRLLAVHMGGVLIKLGQFFSSRVDVLPQEVTSELAGLQDEVPPEKFEDLRQVAEAEFNIPLEDKFDAFDSAPLAAASLGQAHNARIKVELPAGEEGSAVETILQPVVVKIQRPNIKTIINTDLAALRTVGAWLERYSPIRRRADVPALMNEFTRILMEEIDYIAEGRNAETFAQNFKDQAEIRVPQVFWTHTTERVLTLEDVYAIKINDYEEITKTGIDRRQVARRLFNTYLKQIFEDGFFHADPHPGNLFVLPNDAENSDLDQDEGRSWRLTFVDFGMVGRVPAGMREGMREMIIAIGTQDTGRLIKSYQMMGLLLPGADVELLERAEVEMFDRFWGKNMSELTRVSLQEVREIAYQFRDLIYHLPFQIPEDLILLGRTIGILSGMCTGLDPQFNVWEGITPFARKLIAEEAGDGRDAWPETLAVMARRLVALPGRVDNVLQKIERGELSVRDSQLSRQAKLLEGAINRLAGSLVFFALLLGGVQLYVAGHSPLGEILAAGSGLALGWVLLSGRRD